MSTALLYVKTPLGNIVPLLADETGAINAGASVLTVTDTLTALADTVVIDVTGKAAVCVSVTANVDVTGVFEAKIGGVWTAVNGIVPSTGLSVAGFAAAATGVWVVPCAAYDEFRVRASVVGGAPNASVTLEASSAMPSSLLTSSVTVASSALPTGASTAANQATEIASLASIDGKLTVTNAKDFATQTTLAAINTRDALEITESPTATLAYTKATTTDDAAPGDATAVQATLTQSARPSSSVVAFVQLVDGGGTAVAGANCSVRAWLRVTLPGGATYTYIDLGRRDGVYGNKLVTWAFGAIRGSIELFFQVLNVQGAPTSIKVYAMPGADIPGAYDPATGALRSMDILVRGGEQNAIGSHMTSVRVTQSPDGAAAFDDPAALEASSVTKAGPGCLYGFVATNTNAAVRYLQFFDLTAVPADGAVPKLVFALQPGVTMVIQIPPERRYFATGICWCVSHTTPAAKQIAAAETWCNVAYA